MNESCLRVMPYIAHTNESCLRYQWVMSHISMSHVTHWNESCHTYEWVMSQINMQACNLYMHMYTHTHTHTHIQNTHSFFHQPPSSHAHGLIKFFATAKNFNQQQSVKFTIEFFNYHRKYESSQKFKHYDRSFNEFSWLYFPKKKNKISDKGPRASCSRSTSHPL